MKKILLSLVFVLIPVFAQETQAPPTQEQQVAPMPETPVLPTDTYKKQFMATLIAIIVILIIIFLVIWILRRFTPARVYQNNQKKNIKILERRHLSPNTYLYHIQVGEKQFILAESKFHIHNVATIDWNEVKP